MYVVYTFRLANTLVSWGSGWAQFRQSFDEIDGKVKALVVDNEPMSYCQHIGGGNYVSVATGIECVDVRKFFMPYGQTEVKATWKGIALRLPEWSALRKLVETMNNAYSAPEQGTAMLLARRPPEPDRGITMSGVQSVWRILDAVAPAVELYK